MGRSFLAQYDSGRVTRNEMNQQEDHDRYQEQHRNGTQEPPKEKDHGLLAESLLLGHTHSTNDAVRDVREPFQLRDSRERVVRMIEEHIRYIFGKRLRDGRVVLLALGSTLRRTSLVQCVRHGPARVLPVIIGPEGDEVVVG